MPLQGSRTHSPSTLSTPSTSLSPLTMGVGETITVINKSGKVVSNVSPIHRFLAQTPH